MKSFASFNLSGFAWGGFFSVCVAGGGKFFVWGYLGVFLLLVGWGFLGLVFCDHYNIMEPDL